MSFDRPSLADLVAQSRSLLAAKLGTTSPLLDRTPEAALAHVSAGLSDGLWSAIEYLSRQLFPMDASEEFLARHAADRGIPRREGESLDDWRLRIAAAWASPEAGGTENDIISWALSVPGVGRAWPLPAWDGLGSFGVAIANPGAYSRDLTLALAPLVQTVLDTRPPAGVVKQVIVPSESKVALTVRIRPWSQPLAEAVTAAVSALFAEVTPGSVVLWSQMRRIIAEVDGLADHRLLSPYTDFQLPRGALPVVGKTTITAL